MSSSKKRQADGQAEQWVVIGAADALILGDLQLLHDITLIMAKLPYIVLHFGTGPVDLGKDSVVEAPKKAETEPAIIRLRNPKTDETSLYLFSSNSLHLYEVKAFKEEYHSWFIGQTTARDGRLLFITPMDPLFLVLPYFLKAGKEGRFQPVDQVVVEEDFPCCSRLLKCPQILQALRHITEEKEIGGQKFNRYSKEKTPELLKKKIAVQKQGRKK